MNKVEFCLIVRVSLQKEQLGKQNKNIIKTSWVKDCEGKKIDKRIKEFNIIVNSKNAAFR